MSLLRIAIPRVEGGLVLVQDAQGLIRLQTAAPRGLEALLSGRTILDVLQLVQLCGADTGVHHALAALRAWERAGEVELLPAGQVLRRVLEALAIVHAQLRHFYFSALPDYLPPQSLAGYRGGDPELRAAAKRSAQRSPSDRQAQNFPHAFSPAEVQRLWENQREALRALHALQGMLARLGGKYPVVMTFVPGGMATRLEPQLLLQLRHGLEATHYAVTQLLPADCELLLQRYGVLHALGPGPPALLSAGMDGVEDQAFFVAGIVRGERINGAERRERIDDAAGQPGLEAFSTAYSESIAQAFYRPAPAQATVRAIVDAQKAGAVSWIKAPRLRGTLESGPIARSVVAHFARQSGAWPERAGLLVERLKRPVHALNTAGGRLLAGAWEARDLLLRVASLLETLTPGMPTAPARASTPALTGESYGHAEAAAGTVAHRVHWKAGRVTSYDIIAPSAWNGSSRAEDGAAGPLEQALNAGSHSLASKAEARICARIVHSFRFSASDATH